MCTFTRCKTANHNPEAMRNPDRLVECVPNISEGRNASIIQSIADEVESVDGVKLLHVDVGEGTNRTVFTFAGEPEAVLEAAFRLIRKTAELVDMRRQRGAHPRMGATDVCPFIPVRGIEMEEVVELAHRLGERVGEELGIPGYYYEYAAKTEARRRLEHCRRGQYEGLDKLATQEGRPDFGPAEFNERVRKTGAVAIGARKFLIAYNVNLNTTSMRLANEVAMDVRESGRVQRGGDVKRGRVKTEGDAAPSRVPGALKYVKGLGWFIEEFGIAQVSLNLTNIDETPIHIAFEEVRKHAEKRGLRVTGSEIVGLVPKRCLLEAGDYYLSKQGRSPGIPEREKMKIAIKSLGLNDVVPFDPEKKVLEFALGEKGPDTAGLSLAEFADRVSSDKAMPGGGCVAAYIGALGASLGGMVANISAQKKGWESSWQTFAEWAVKAEGLKVELLHAIDDDMKAYDDWRAVMKKYRHTKPDGEGRAEIGQAETRLVRVPMGIARAAARTLPLLRAMAESGTPGAIADVSVGLMCARTAVQASILNARSNSTALADEGLKEEFLRGCAEIEKAFAEGARAIQDILDGKLPA